MRLSTVLAFAFSTVVGIAQAQSIGVPVPRDGDSWQFQTFNLWNSNLTSRVSRKTVGTSGEYVRTVFESQATGQNGEITKPEIAEATTRADLNQTVMYRGEKQERVWYKWPLAPGEKWAFQMKEELPPTVSATQSRTMTSTWQAEVFGPEILEVPAGKFKTI